MKNSMLRLLHRSYYDWLPHIICLFLLTTFSATSVAAQRHALVIGNSDYSGAYGLVNPRNDAMAVASKLNEIGYDVHTGGASLELTLDQFNETLDAFLETVENGDTVVVYYAGHGAAASGTNYLIPILPPGVKLRTETDLIYKTVMLNGLLERMEFTNPDGVNVFFIDACRDAPVTAASRTINLTGLSELDSRNQPHGSFVGFATDYGMVANDGVGARNSPFTESLLEGLDVAANLPIELFYKRVSDRVYRRTDGQQIPIQEPKIYGEFCLVPCSTFNPTPIESAPGIVEPVKPQPVASVEKFPQTEGNSRRLLWGIAAVVAAGLIISGSSGSGESSPGQDVDVVLTVPVP